MNNLILVNRDIKLRFDQKDDFGRFPVSEQLVMDPILPHVTQRCVIEARSNTKYTVSLGLPISPTCTFTLFLFVADSNAIALKLSFYHSTKDLSVKSEKSVKSTIYLNVASSGALISTL